MIDKLISYYKECLQYMKLNPGEKNVETRKCFFDHAFGATEIVGRLNPELNSELSELWNEKWREKLEKAVYNL